MRAGGVASVGGGACVDRAVAVMGGACAQRAGSGPGVVGC